MEKVSVIVLSYNRPHNIEKLVSKLLKFSEIDEIIVLYGHKDYMNTINNKKVIGVNNCEENDKLYLLRRYDSNNYKMIKNDCILLLDDDLIPSHNLLKKMIEKYKNNKTGLYGPQRRYCGNNYEDTTNMKNLFFYLFISSIGLLSSSITLLYFYRNFYTKLFLTISVIYTIVMLSLWLSVKEHNTIIPGLSIVNKDVLDETWKEMNNNEYKEIVKEIIDNKGNGEDLFFNFVYRKLYGNPIYVDGKYEDLDVSNGFSTTNSNEHMKYRQNFCSRLQKFK